MDVFTTGSPVRVDSLTWRETASSSSPSAGISTPVFNTRISPTTTSFLGISVTCPSRMTCTRSSSLTWFRISKALLAFTSNQKPMPVASMMATKIPIGSKKTLLSPMWVPSWKYSKQAMPTEARSATSRMRMIGSENFSRNCFHSGSFAAGVKMFAPYFSRLSSTCSWDNPW